MLKEELPNPNPWSLLQLQSYPFSITASLPRQMSKINKFSPMTKAVFSWLGARHNGPDVVVVFDVPHPVLVDLPSHKLGQR